MADKLTGCCDSTFHCGHPNYTLLLKVGLLLRWQCQMSGIVAHVWTDAEVGVFVTTQLLDLPTHVKVPKFMHNRDFKVPE